MQDGSQAELHAVLRQHYAQLESLVAKAMQRQDACQTRLEMLLTALARTEPKESPATNGDVDAEPDLTVDLDVYGSPSSPSLKPPASEPLVKFASSTFDTKSSRDMLAEYERVEKDHIRKKRARLRRLSAHSAKSTEWNDDGHISVQSPLASAAAEIVFNKKFDYTVVVVIFAYCAFVGLQVECRGPWTDCGVFDEALTAFDIFFWFAFCLELCLRAAVISWREFFFGEHRLWNLLDLILVIVSTVDLVFTMILSYTVDANVSVLRLMRTLRTARIVKVVRVLRFFKDLRILVAGIMSALKPLTWAMGLLFMIIYFFAVIFTQVAVEYLERTSALTNVFGPSSPEVQMFFGSIPRSMYSLLLAVTGGDNWKAFARALSDVGWPYVALFIAYVLFIVFAVSNVMTGLFCNNALEMAARDNDLVVQELLAEKETISNKLRNICKERLEVGNTGMLYISELGDKLESSDLKAWFESIDIDIEDGWTLFKLLDTTESGGIPIDDFVEGCVHLRGHAKKIDIKQIIFDQQRILREFGMYTLHGEPAMNVETTTTAQPSMKPGKSADWGV